MTTTVLVRGLVGDWRHRAACRGVDPELFFPAADSGPLYEAQVVEARAVCVGCPVRTECLGFALAALPYGIAGGLTPGERRCVGRGDRGGGVGTVEERPLAGASSAEVAAAGRVLLRAGRPVGEVARGFGVSDRTAERWAAQVRVEHDRGVVEAFGDAPAGTSWSRGRAVGAGGAG